MCTFAKTAKSWADDALFPGGDCSPSLLFSANCFVLNGRVPAVANDIDEALLLLLDVPVL